MPPLRLGTKAMTPPSKSLPQSRHSPAVVDLRQISVILLDIEGTTTPAEFVYQTLFPYARKHLKSFLERHTTRPEVLSDIDLLRREYSEDRKKDPQIPDWRMDSREADLASAALYADWLMKQDRKSTALKSLQGKIWEEGYGGGVLRGLVYDDVPQALNRWKAAGKEICIFSSGSILAQILLFTTTSHGDLTPFFRAHFDTTTGSKLAPESYQRIAVALKRSTSEVLFISDVAAELDAARLVGIEVVLCMRSDGPGTSLSDYSIIHSFHEI